MRSVNVRVICNHMNTAVSSYCIVGLVLFREIFF